MIPRCLRRGSSFFSTHNWVVEVKSWRPKGLSLQIAETLHGAFKKAREDFGFIKVSKQVDQPPLYRGPEDLARHPVKMKDEVGGLIQSLGLREE